MTQSVDYSRVRQAAVAAALALLLGCATAGPAAALDLFARHEVTVEFATADGKPMADAEVQVFAPGQPNRPAQTGRTDKNGKFEFSADTDGFWRAEAHIGGEIAHVSVRVGSDKPSEPLSPIWVIGGLFLLLAVAFGLRIARARLLRRQGSR